MFSKKLFLLTLCILTISCEDTKDSIESYSPPIDAAVLVYLADHLENRECAQLSTFLALQDISAIGKSKDSKNWGGNNVDKSFACHRTLKIWNENIGATMAEGRLDGEELVEQTLVIGLKQVNRSDLATWLQKLMTQKRHLEISGMEATRGREDDGGFGPRKYEKIAEYLRKGKHGGYENQSRINSTMYTTTTPAPTTEVIEDKEVNLEQDLPPQMLYIIIFGIGAVLATLGAYLMIKTCSRKPNGRYEIQQLRVVPPPKV